MKAFAKINIFLKIVGKRENYHEIISRFVRYDELFDEIEFVPRKADGFVIEGMDIPIQKNIIYKAYRRLLEVSDSVKLKNFFTTHIVSVQKRIPQGAGLGGGSSDAATFLLMCNETIGLGLSKEQLLKIGATIGADVPFFLSGYKSANVFGIGERIEPFEDDIPAIELKLLDICCDTAKVYRHYRKHYYMPNIEEAQKMAKTSSREILSSFQPLHTNDLFKSAIDLCPALGEYCKSWYLSGSGSSLFKGKV